MAGFLLSLFFGFVPMLVFAWMIYWVDRYEKEPKILLGAVFVWGAVVAAGAAFVINTLFGLGVYIFTQSDFATELTTGALIAPIVEESLKGFAVLIVFLIFRREFDSILDGIVYAAIAAVGFAATENVFYIYTYGFQETGWSGLLALTFVRVVLVGWQHPFYTAFTGIGLAITRLSRRAVVKIFAPILGLGLAVFTHAMHNTLATFLQGVEGLTFGTLLDWLGWLLMLLVIIWAVQREQNWIITFLQEEVALGHITPAQYKTACSAVAQSGARFNALFNGRYRYTHRFYQICAELSHKKQQRATLGDEGGNSAIIERLRSELARLSPQV